MNISAGQMTITQREDEARRCNELREPDPYLDRHGTLDWGRGAGHAWWFRGWRHGSHRREDGTLWSYQEKRLGKGVILRYHVAWRSASGLGEIVKWSCWAAGKGVIAQGEEYHPWDAMIASHLAAVELAGVAAPDDEYLPAKPPPFATWRPEAGDARTGVPAPPDTEPEEVVAIVETVVG